LRGEFGSLNVGVEVNVGNSRRGKENDAIGASKIKLERIGGEKGQFGNVFSRSPWECAQN